MKRELGWLGLVALLSVPCPLFAADKPEPEKPAAEKPADAPEVDVTALTAEERLALIAEGDQKPDLLRALLKALPAEVPAEEAAALIRLDEKRLAGDRRPAANRLAVDIFTALLIRENGLAHQYVRQVFESYPERRPAAATAIARYALARKRLKEDWPTLVRALNVVEGGQARVVLRALARFDQRATKARWVREAILLGLAQDEAGQADAVALIEHWTGEKLGQPDQPAAEKLALWQKWFAEKHPTEPAAVLPQDPPNAKWKFADLRRYLLSEAAWKADPAAGQAVYEKARCAKCHTFRGQGEKLGPELSDIRGRLSTAELLTAMLYPSEYVSDQYPTHIFVTKDGRTIRGVAAPGRIDEMVILQSNGEKTTVPRSEIESNTLISQSSMPENTLDPLTREEIAALFSFLRTPPQ